MVHGSGWNGIQTTIWEALETNSYHDKNALVCRLIGYGPTEIEKVQYCTQQRVTLLGWGNLSDGEAHCYSLPVPASLNSAPIKRRLTVTLSWLTPINPLHQDYRKAHLWFAPYGADSSDGQFQKTLRVKRLEADWQAVQRGTIQHEIFEGDKAAPFEEDSTLQLQVNCRAQAGKLTERVNYGLALTLEIAQGIDLPIYDQVQARIRPAVRVNI
jgi:hypothetical protein